jgi:HNH endonuclease
MTRFEITWLEDRSDESVLDEIRRVASLYPGRRMTRRMFNRASRIKSSSVENRFGSWGEATRRAGLTSAVPIYSETAVIGDLQRVSALTEEGPLTQASYGKNGHYSVAHITKRFGGWREALIQAGIGHRYAGPMVTERMRAQTGRRLTDNGLLDQIRKVSARLDRATLSGAEIAANSEVTQSQMYRRFGSVSAALKMAGIEQVSHGRRHTQDEVFENLLTVWTHYGRPPTVHEMDRPPSRIGSGTYLHRWGRWRSALKAFVERANSESDRTAGIPPGQETPTATTQGRGLLRESGAAGTLATVPALSGRQLVRRDHRSRPPATSTPRERREPSIGLRFKVLRRDHFKCVLCGDHPARNAECVLHVDHILPWSRGGRTLEENLRTLCAKCNVGRGNRDAGGDS